MRALIHVELKRAHSSSSGSASTAEPHIGTEHFATPKPRPARAGRAHPVWTVTSRELPGLLVLRGEVRGVRIYAVDREVPEEVLYG